MAKLKPFTMPKWGIEMSEGAIAEWMVAENEPFTRGTVLTFIETDKITNEVEAEADGRFVRLIAEPGRTYPVGALLAVLSDGGGASAEEIDAVVASFRASGSGFAPEGERVGHADNAPVDRVGVSVPDGMAISPVARARAEAAGVDVALI
ncbi:MAG TPA: biotin/lipoyl-containing protein, partial [Sphingomonas sp.]|nr:biotin/lipoyl-containing protein [Sphingomonas sp.]